MHVANIKWLSLPAAEAEVEIVDGVVKCVAFSCPCEVDVGDEIIGPLHVFNLRNAVLVDNVGESISLMGNTGLSHHVVAKLIDPARQICGVGNILLSVEDDLPGGSEEGNLLAFECGRIDLW